MEQHQGYGNGHHVGHDAPEVAPNQFPQNGHYYSPEYAPPSTAGNPFWDHETDTNKIVLPNGPLIESGKEVNTISWQATSSEAPEYAPYTEAGPTHPVTDKNSKRKRWIIIIAVAVIVIIAVVVGTTVGVLVSKRNSR
jgi:hypothetical protein